MRGAEPGRGAGAVPGPGGGSGLRRSLEWVPGAEVVVTRDRVSVSHPGGRLTLVASEQVSQAVAVLGEGAGDDDAVADAWAAGGDVQALVDGYGFVAGLRAARVVDDVFRAADGACVVAVNGATGHPADVVPQSLVLSPHAFLRREDRGVVVDEPVHGGRVRVPDPARALREPVLGALARGGTADGSLLDAEPTGVLAALYSAGLVVDGDGTVPGALQMWEFHDLLMHQRSRIGRHAEPIGATFPFAGVRPPEPSHLDVKFPTGARIPLPAPPVQGPGPGIFDVLARRHSVRRSDRVLDLGRLGAVLHESARITAYHPAGAGERSYPATRRPYPSGGAAYDLEIYPVVRRCTGLDGGVYYYNPAHHVLEQVSTDAGAVAQLTGLATSATGGLADPQVLLVVTSRFGRLTWKYRSISYATTLKNLGALYQTLYLVATALDVSPCALGTGSSSLFAEVTGLALHEESAVGEFLLSG